MLLAHAGKVFVRTVDCSEAPQAAGLAEHARQLGNEVYPRIFILLAESPSNSPGQFDIIWKKRLESDYPALTHRTTINLSAQWLLRNPTNLAWVAEHTEDFDKILVHEMVHVVQRYWTNKKMQVPFCWEEGIADYVRYKLGFTNGWACPRCSAAAYPHYSSGYWCAGAFLFYLDGAECR